MANENNKKVPCGGFYLGDGLIMDGNTLESLGGEQVQSDYAQNDSTAKDYIKNRPGGYEEGWEITWDGDTTGRVSISASDGTSWYKISDEILTVDQLIGSTVTLNNGRSLDITAKMIATFENCITVADAVLIAKTAGDLMGNGKFIAPETGVYDLLYDDLFASSLSNISAYPFPDKYIPDTIARKAELDSRITEKEVILTSSTTDSTKKFKITVNDSGALTATEITK